MSMGRRKPIARTATEQDATTGWKHVLCYMQRPGQSAKAKRHMRRRLRRQGKQEARAEW